MRGINESFRKQSREGLQIAFPEDLALEWKEDIPDGNASAREVPRFSVKEGIVAGD